jgi:hypothetical protein
MSRKLRTPSLEACPKCKSDLNIRQKLLMLGKEPIDIFNRDNRCGYRRWDSLAIDECNSQVLLSPPLEQFVTGFYCDRCGIGYIPDSYLLPGSYSANVACYNKSREYFERKT